MSIERYPLSVSALPGGASCVELLPGDVFLGRAGDQMKTVLGSCVSVILTDPRRTAGAMCHIVHVGKPNAANASNTAYGDVAMQQMFDQLSAVGLTPSRCLAYVYGGGNMFAQRVSTAHIGQKNAQWVLNFLQHRGIAIVDQSVGGNGYRKVAWTVGFEAPVWKTYSLPRHDLITCALYFLDFS